MVYSPKILCFDRDSVVREKDTAGRVWPANLIVVDQGYNPNAAEWIKFIRSSLGIRSQHIVSQQKGPAAARNRGIEIAHSKYIAALDDDCIPSKDWLRRLMQKLTQNSGVVVTAG